MNKLRHILAFMVLGLCAAYASPAETIQLVQGEWSSGGPLSLSFTAQDLNMDRWIERSELSGFRGDFRFEEGTRTSWFLSDLALDGFFFHATGDFAVFARNAEYSLIGTASEGEVLTSIVDSFLFPIAETQALPVLTPEPSTSVLLGMIAIVGLARRIRGSTSQHRRHLPFSSSSFRDF